MSHTVNFTLDNNFTTGIELLILCILSRMYQNTLMTIIRHSSQTGDYTYNASVLRSKHINVKLGTPGDPNGQKANGTRNFKKKLNLRYFNSNSYIIDNSCVNSMNLKKTNKNYKHFINNKLIHLIVPQKILSYLTKHKKNSVIKL